VNAYQQTVGVTIGHVTFLSNASTGTATLRFWVFPNGGNSGQNDQLGRTNYVPVAGGIGRIGYAAWDQWAGTFYNRSKVAISDMTDGTSNTFVIGEYAGGFNASNVMEYSASWMGVGGMGTAWGIDPKLQGQTRPYRTQFGSMHPGIVQFVFADGSVRSISLTITDVSGQRYYRMLSATQDGLVIPGDAVN
jgi:hypothetical protein